MFNSRSRAVGNKMLKLCFMLIIPLVCTNNFSYGHVTSESRFYRVSMVSSTDNPDKPALFSHAESPVWDSVRNALFFVDVHRQNVHRLDYSSGHIYTQHIEYGQVNVVALVANSQRLLVAVRAGLYLMDWGVSGDAALRLLATVDDGLPDNVINDGKADANGRFWAGTKGPQIENDVVPDQAQFFSIEQGKLTPRLHLKPVSISNGLVWSHNNTVLFYIDSPTKKIEAFDFNLDKGELNITNYGYPDALPDGMTIDNQGHLWVALMFGGTVLHINPDTRQIVYGYKLPASRVTSLAWGGPNYDELFVTTGRNPVDVSTEPLGGAIFTLRNTGSVGVATVPFRFDNADIY